MLALPDDIIAVFTAFAPVFTQPTFRRVQILLLGMVLAPGKRTVTAALRAMGLSHEKHFQNYHRVLNRAQWSPRKAAGILLRLLVSAFVAEGTIVIGIDDTLERRRGAKIAAKGIYRDSVRSSKSFFVKSSGLRWIAMMLLVPIPFSGCVWALPFFVLLAPSERYHEEQGIAHKTLADWAWQMIWQVRRWLPDRALVFVADQSYAVIDLLDRCVSLGQPVTMITRLRLDAALYEPAPPRPPGKKGAPRKKGERLPTLKALLSDAATQWTQATIDNWYGQGERQVEFASGTCVWYHSGKPVVPIRWVLIRDPEGKFEAQALLCTDQKADPVQIISWFIRRWRMEVTFQECRAHLGIETQRQWNDKAIERTTPMLFALFSLVALLAHQWMPGEPEPIRQAAWYVKEQPTFSDAIALVRRRLWPHALFCMSDPQADMQITQQDLLERFAELLCYAA